MVSCNYCAWMKSANCMRMKQHYSNRKSILGWGARIIEPREMEVNWPNRPSGVEPEVLGRLRNTQLGFACEI